MGFLRKIKTAPLEDKMNEELRQRRESDPFGFAEYDAANAERAGYLIILTGKARFELLSGTRLQQLRL